MVLYAKKVFLPAIAVCLLGLSQPGRAGAERDIVLFGANWCAPCRGELKDLPDLADAAAPDRIVLAWIEGTPRVTPTPGVTVMPRDEAAALFQRISPGGSGLPLAAILDQDGKPCALLRRRLRTERLESFRGSCPR